MSYLLSFIKRLLKKSPQSKRTPPALTFSNVPGTPHSFGYKCQWLTVKTADTEAVAKALKLVDIQAANWATGIAGAYEGYYFVSPPVEGWTFVVNALMPDATDQLESGPLQTVTDLSVVFEEAYYFGTHRVVSYHAWARARHGRLTRAYGYLGERGETLFNHGELTAEETKHDLYFTEQEDDMQMLPDEEHVLLIAREWSLDPLELGKVQKVGVGLVGIKE
ncbi:hypothetical protein [Paenibacillus paridis]|uniref:hypothetical protein n=1 Tax=Paenibacillus paridis TaxID=2583376 RepID=UPI00111DF41E|nr:hypothetical protein [Paenibacillus paridis]